MRYLVVACLIVMSAVLVGTGTAAAPSKPKQDELWRLTTTGPKLPSTKQGVRISPHEAQAMMAKLDAEAEADPLATFSSSSFATMSAAGVCWNRDDLTVQHGYLIQKQVVREHRIWCAGSLGGYQTSRSSYVRGEVLTCSWDRPYHYKISGGNGYKWTKVRSGASFACPSGIPWLEWHFDIWQEWSCNTWGTCAREADNGN